MIANLFRAFFLLAWLGATVSIWQGLPRKPNDHWLENAASFAGTVMLTPYFLGAVSTHALVKWYKKERNML